MSEPLQGDIWSDLVATIEQLVSLDLDLEVEAYSGYLVQRHKWSPHRDNVGLGLDLSSLHGHYVNLQLTVTPLYGIYSIW